MKPGNPSDINVAVACDIKLGKLFRSRPSFEGAYIDVNPESIQHILHSFSTDEAGPQEVLVTACDQSTLGPETEGRTGYRRHSPQQQYSFEVQVSVTDTDNRVRLAPHAQTIFVHELRHVADLTNEDYLKEHRSFVRMTRLKALAKAAGAGILVSLAGLEVANATDNILPAVAAGAFIPSIFMRGTRKAKREELLEAPLEQRAYAAEEQAPFLPQIITWVPPSSERA